MTPVFTCRSLTFDLEVLDGELLAGAGKGCGEIAAAIVSHDALDGDAETLELGDGGE
jgi:hypothetical protein